MAWGWTGHGFLLKKGCKSTSLTVIRWSGSQHSIRLIRSMHSPGCPSNLRQRLFDLLELMLSITSNWGRVKNSGQSFFLHGLPIRSQIWTYWSTSFLPGKIGMPLFKSSHRMHPRAQTSTGNPYLGHLSKISGALYQSVTSLGVSVWM